MNQKIDWTTIEGRYVRLKTGVKSTLVLANWTTGKWFGKMGIGFDVLEEGGKQVSKQLTVTNRSLIQAFKPILLKAEDEEKDTVAVSITRTGDGLDTRYAVEELPVTKKEPEGLL